MSFKIIILGDSGVGKSSIMYIFFLQTNNNFYNYHFEKKKN